MCVNAFKMHMCECSLNACCIQYMLTMRLYYFFTYRTEENISNAMVHSYYARFACVFLRIKSHRKHTAHAHVIYRHSKLYARYTL